MTKLFVSRTGLGEKIGGGFFVFRRNKESGRIQPGNLPFEHPTAAAALEEAKRLAAKHPGETFQVFAAGVTAYVEATVSVGRVVENVERERMIA
jgi:hypothetical protein